MKIRRSILIFALVLTIANINAGSSVGKSVDFYGHQLNMAYDQQISNLNLNTLSQKEVTYNLEAYRNENLSKSVYYIKKHIAFYKLDGTATTLLVDKFAAEITNSINKKNFVKYITLKELGYDVILTRTGKKLNCLGNLSYKPGRYIYIKYANKVYKDLDFKNRTNYSKHLIYIDGKKTYRTIERNVLRVPAIHAKIKDKNVSFVFKAQEYEVNAVSNESITEFLGDLPLFDVGREFTHLSMSKEMNSSVVRYLRQKVVGMDKVEASRFLLSFVQQVVPYGSDFEKYGEERFYYPEETIMSKNADCEDKAILLSYLAKRILNVKSVGLFFENDEHLSLALEIPDYAPAGSFKYNGHTYIPCEPTAKYPRLGQSQFSLNRVTEVINL
jgi:hypothetical protein